jgi:quinol monooxygenase YgiN
MIELSRFGLFGKLIATEGNRDLLVEILLEAATSMENLADCEVYVVNISPDDRDSVFVYEVWKSESAHQNSLTLDVTQTLIQRAKPIIAGMERIKTLMPLGGKGINSFH